MSGLTLSLRLQDTLTLQMQSGAGRMTEPAAHMDDSANMIADPFYPSRTGGYSAGEYVTKNGRLYVFTADHTQDASWNANDTAETKVGPVLTQILARLSALESGSAAPLTAAFGTAVFGAATFA